MCNVGKIISCQIAFSPIVSDDYKKDVHQVIDIIEQSGVDFEVGLLSTEIKGDKETIFQLIETIFKTMDTQSGFTMDVKYSNLCGR